MKKRLRSVVCFIFAAVFLFTVFVPMQIASAANSYYISDYNINVVINSDGSAEFEEAITYNFSGQFNGTLRDVDFSQTKGIENISVYVLKNNNLQKFIQNNTANLNYQGSVGTYNFVKEGNLAHFKIFERSKNEKKTFVIKYKMLDVVTKYNDIAEYNRKVIDKSWQTKLENINIKITLPVGATKQDIKVFAHGPLTGESKILDDTNVEFTVPTVSGGTFVETLVLFPTKLVPYSTNIVNKNALPGILENEKNLAQQANEIRQQARQQLEQQIQKEAQLSVIGNALTLILIVVWILLFIFIYIKYDKEFKPSFQGKYYRELPGEYTPAEMGYLMSFGSVGTNDIMATLMDLVRKRHLKITVDKIIKKGIFGDKEIEQYTVSLNENPPKSELKEHEEYLISWFINKIGNGNLVTFEEIKEYVKSRANALEFRSDYDFWSNLVKVQASKNNFIDKTCRTGKTIGLIAGIIYVIIGFLIVSQLYSPIAAFLMLLGLIILFYSIRFQRRTKYGSDQHAMWKAFKDFLLDFSKLNKAEIPSIVIWEHYLVYAISLGVAKQVIKQLPLVFNEGDLNDGGLTFMYGMHFGYFYGLSSMFDNTIHTVDAAVTTAANIANSKNSSFTGGGGGFSGGSSFGGGGGGGGGAF